ncbi:FecR domain-containing protein [Leptospira sp. 2 VSF19]|uniref:FecR domain-containing protein n=1 Tax=Leptospira soteropolitanensis TaxID=2950025 RepID=A0AAW5VIN9_9LEPT|nr:FecR family protein [Leptospira soteropolitanensis]MCW7493638.1 FecR domain-containing protein [Leptospira soteropolitanensis]MCW7501237.1 FecR domain-containing protein [Leptospira soteropolitanensis]MCW7523577.1 FecR domain-containing protein [Leptospira soteropolitanensis]MCW7527350.1 FecR domain-containing protein [Leptospira soteropolitanensis]MCW7531207.1 FecR domain-containing protein [Leptospira soteropolitanensis]
MKTTTKLLTIFILIFALQCHKFQFGSNQTNDQTAGAVVTFYQGNITISSQGKESKVKIGDVVRPGDRIVTKLGRVDLQTYRGEVIRIKDNSDILFRDIAGESRPNTDIHMLAGNLLVKSVKLKSGQNLSVTSPTMVAGVRGTVFSFELDKGSIPEVKVYEGAVSVAFKTSPKLVEINEGLSAENYNRLVKTLEENEVVLEPGERLEVNPNLNELVYLINAKVPANALTNEQISGLIGIDSGLSKSPSAITPQEKAEAETLVSITSETIQKQIESQSSNPSETTGVGTIEKEHEAKRTEALNQIAKEAEKAGLDNEEEIHSHYSILETIHKTNGDILSGAVVAQLGDIFIIHSTKGVFQLSVDDIEYVEYRNFKVKTKAKK